MRLRVRPAPFPIPPAVVATLVHGTLVAIWFLWLAATARFPTFEEAGPFRLIETDAYLALSAIDAALAIALVACLVRARRATHALRAAHTGGAILGLVLVALIQYGGSIVHGPLPPRAAAPDGGPGLDSTEVETTAGDRR